MKAIIVFLINGFMVGLINNRFFLYGQKSIYRIFKESGNNDRVIDDINEALGIFASVLKRLF